jgi:hypothetical protein
VSLHIKVLKLLPERWQHGKKYSVNRADSKKFPSVTWCRGSNVEYSKFPDVQGTVDTVKEFIDFIVSGFRFGSHIYKAG